MNSWNWESFEEFKKEVYPIEHAPENIVRVQKHAAASRNIHSLFEYIWEYDSAYRKLKGFLARTVEQPISKEEQDEVCLAASQLSVAKYFVLLRAGCPIVETKSGSTQDRWRRAAKETALDSIRNRIILETQAEHLLACLKAGLAHTRKSGRFYANDAREVADFNPRFQFVAQYCVAFTWKELLHAVELEP